MFQAQKFCGVRAAYPGRASQALVVRTLFQPQTSNLLLSCHMSSVRTAASKAVVQISYERGVGIIRGDGWVPISGEGVGGGGS
jgi:hypothetical protein